ESGEAGGPVYASYLRSIDGAVPLRLGSGRAMSLSADGRYAVAIPIEAPHRVDLLPLGPGEGRALRGTGVSEFQWAARTPAGASLVFTATRGESRPRVYVKPLAGGPARPLTPEGVGLWTNALAPDGTAVAVPGEGGIRIYPLDGGEPRPIPDSAKMV